MPRTAPLIVQTIVSASIRGDKMLQRNPLTSTRPLSWKKRGSRFLFSRGIPEKERKPVLFLVFIFSIVRNIFSIIQKLIKLLESEN